ncbi:MAG: hypothetical protein HGJ93_19735 [Desulfosarcina sp.]|nr:hypothetical protein [Desulfosarcina sp.]MBC2768094.1 hypothetical protein [Desulfosarcina sp.]
MKPSNQWPSDWRIGINPSRETTVAEELLRIFTRFWETLGLNEKSKTQKNRYANSLHALGGYLVEQAISEEYRSMPIRELLFTHIDENEGPLIHQDNGTWQAEIDMVCRKLYKYLKEMEGKWQKTTQSS